MWDLIVSVPDHCLSFYFVASWYRPPGNTSEEFHLFGEQLGYIRTRYKGKKLPSVHVLGDFNFKDIDWPDRLSKSGSTLSQSEGQILIKQAEIIEAFKSTSRYLDDLLNIDNPYFEGMVNRIYPPELQLNKGNTSDTEAPFLDLHLSISNGF